MQLAKETGLLINFLTDLEGKYAQQVATLSFTPFITNLRAANEKVRTLTANRTNERMMVIVGALKASRRMVDDAYRNVVRLITRLSSTM